MATWPIWPSTSIGRGSSRGTWSIKRTRKVDGGPGRCCKLPCGRPSNAVWRAVSPNEDLNAQIASAILSCFPADLFDSTGLFRSLWLHRMSNVTSDVQGMIETLVGSEPAGAEERLRRFGR